MTAARSLIKRNSTAGSYTPLNPLKGAARKRVLMNCGLVCWVSPLGAGGSEGSNGFLNSFGMTVARSSQLVAHHPACHLDPEYSGERSATKEAACNGFLIAFEMTATCGFKNEYSTVFHSSQFLLVSPLGGNPGGKGGLTISFPKSVPSTANEQGMEVFSLRSSTPPLGGRGEEEPAIRACEILRFFNN